jgi:hypothetical protein
MYLKPSKMNLDKLNEPLCVGQIEFKVAQVFKTDKAVWANILAYKDARVDMQVLDEACGQMNWQVKYERDSKGVLQCAVGIWDDAKGLGAGDWVWKTSNGTESDFESEKGEYSDAFKRACFMWGIGRQLYDFPTIRVQLNEADYYEENGKVKVKGWVRPSEWRWFVSEDYQKVKCDRKFGNTWKTIFNTNPYDKDNE